VAVAAFLERRLSFDRIAVMIDAVLQTLPVTPASGLDEVLEADAAARREARHWLQRLA